MNVWLINQYITSPQLGNEGHRHFYLARHLTRQGYKMSLITSNFSHVPKKDVAIQGRYGIFEEEGISTIVLKTNKYKSARSVGRILNMFAFFFMLFLLPFKKMSKPDVIVVSSISLFPILFALLYRWRHKDCKFILEIRDIWPLTLIEIGNYSPNNPFVLLLAFIEKLGYQKADYLVSNLPNANKHFKEVLGERPFKFEWISNGMEIGDGLEEQALDGQLAAQIDPTTFNIGYAGTIGQANAMEYLVEAAHSLASNKRVKIYIVGSGYLKEELEQRVADLDNIVFLGRIPHQQVQSFLKKMDLLYLSWQNSPLYRFGVSANKIFDYMYAGVPILMSGEIPANPITLSDCGWVIPAEDTKAIIDSINSIVTLSEQELEQKGQNGRAAVLKQFSYSYLASKYGSLFKELVALSPAKQKFLV